MTFLPGQRVTPHVGEIGLGTVFGLNPDGRYLVRLDSGTVAAYAEAELSIPTPWVEPPSRWLRFTDDELEAIVFNVAEADDEITIASGIRDEALAELDRRARERIAGDCEEMLGDNPDIVRLISDRLDRAFLLGDDGDAVGTDGSDGDEMGTSP